MTSTARAFLLIAAAGLMPMVALADRDDRRDDRSAIVLPHSEAIEIARQNGVAEVRETRARRGMWKVEGWTAEGEKIEVRMDGQTGEVISVEIYGRSGSSSRSWDDSSHD